MTYTTYEIEIGAAPHNEDCAQLGSENYSSRSRQECTAFKEQILRHYPVPEGVDAGVRTSVNPHEFGSYREVAAAYSCIRGEQWAMEVEKDPKNMLGEWDDAARIALGLETANSNSI